MSARVASRRWPARRVLPAALVTAGILRAPALALYGRALGHEPRDVQPTGIDVPIELDVPGIPKPEP